MSNYRVKVTNNVTGQTKEVGNGYDSQRNAEKACRDHQNATGTSNSYEIKSRS